MSEMMSLDEMTRRLSAVRARFEEGKPADPTENMTEEQKAEWWAQHEKNKDNFKSAALPGDITPPETETDTEGRFEEGKPADPTENMSEEDKKKWEAMNEEHGDKFKTAVRKLNWPDGDRSAPWTPWGPAQYATEVERGVRLYGTAGHGGLAVAQGVARRLLTPAALKMGDFANGYYWYEEDVAVSIPFYEHPEWTMPLFHKTYPKDYWEKQVRTNFPKYFSLIEQGVKHAPKLYEGMQLQVVAPVEFMNGYTMKPGDVVTVTDVKKGTFTVDRQYRIRMPLYYGTSFQDPKFVPVATGVTATIRQRLTWKAAEAHTYVMSLAPDGMPRVDGFVDEILFAMIVAKILKLRPNQVQPAGRNVNVAGKRMTWEEALHAVYREYDPQGNPPAHNTFRVKVNVGSIYEQGMRAAAEETPAPEGEEKKDEQTKEAASGLYGFTKQVQGDCEACSRKVAKYAARVAKAVTSRDDQVGAFLSTHARRTGSLPAQILVAAITDMAPKVASETPKTTDKEAAVGLYGFKSKTATLGLNACAELRGFAGEAAASLHGRRTALHANITGFLTTHAKKGKDNYARLLLDSYPDAPVPEPPEKQASTPRTVEEWISWDK